RWLLGQVPGLGSSQFNGRLAGDWQAERLTWQDGAGSEVELTGVQVRWSPLCLLRGALCVEFFSAAQIRVDLAPSPADDDSSTGLPDVRLPLQLELGRIDIGSLSIASQTLADIEVELQGRGDQL